MHVVLAAVVIGMIIPTYEIKEERQRVHQVDYCSSY